MGGDGGGWAGDFPARGCQMCDLGLHSAIRATADWKREAHGNLYGCEEMNKVRRTKEKSAEVETVEISNMTNRHIRNYDTKKEI